MQTDPLEVFNLTGRYEIERREIFLCAAISAAFAIVIGYYAGLIAAIAALYLILVMMLITIIDHRQFVIPNVLSLPAIPLGLAAAGFMGSHDTLEAIIWHAIASIVAAAFLYAVRQVYRQVRGFEGLGMGDVKLGAAAGAWVGLELLAMTCLLSCLAGIATLALSKLQSPSTPLDLKQTLPFGSFIAPSIVIMWIFKILTN